MKTKSKKILFTFAEEITSLQLIQKSIDSVGRIVRPLAYLPGTFFIQFSVYNSLSIKKMVKKSRQLPQLFSD